MESAPALGASVSQIRSPTRSAAAGPGRRFRILLNMLNFLAIIAYF
jgi:hypothetical protein